MPEYKRYVPEEPKAEPAVAPTVAPEPVVEPEARPEIRHRRFPEPKKSLVEKEPAKEGTVNADPE